jgi:hypothetical protein
MQTTITEQCGAVWKIESTGQQGTRAFWAQRSPNARSVAKPHVIGFYAASLNDAANQLNN